MKMDVSLLAVDAKSQTTVVGSTKKKIGRATNSGVMLQKPNHKPIGGEKNANAIIVPRNMRGILLARPC
jgi:hypothetical protein